mmetsp:Transcript_97810/g.292157  ORF Transcript_97810/g.292157 Transcript_97810/m.292157 type:complete len:442 (-) Transcript_97810:249-1574(-)
MAEAAAVPKSVLVYSHSWLPGQVDGVAVRIMAHVQALADRGSKVTVATPDFVIEGTEHAKPKELVSIPGVEHVTLQTQRTPVYRKNLCMRYSIGNLMTLIRLIRRTKPDIVHGTQEASLQVLATACLICNVPLVISLHTDVAMIAVRDYGFSTLGGLLGRLHAHLAVRFVWWGYRNWAVAGGTFFPVSKQAREVLRDAGVRQTRVVPETWGPMVDRKVFRVDQDEKAVAEARERYTFGIPDAFLMAYLGRITAEKDIQFLVDALGRAPQRVVLALVGSGSMVPELSKLHGKEHRLHCTGEFVGREQVALALRACDACVSASVMETVGFTAMEALSCGTPMLAANAQGFAEHLSHGVNSRLFVPGDAGSFDRELAALMATERTGCWTREALRASMTAASVDACTDRSLSAYQSATRANRRALRLVLTILMFYVNWSFSWVIR